MEYILLTASFVFCALGVIAFWPNQKQNHMSVRRRLMLLALGVIFASFFIQCAISFQEEAKTAWYAFISNCFVNTMQMFSLDANYGEIIEKVSELTGNSTFGAIIGAYAALINIIASVTGGAIILDALTSVFPSMRLFFCRRQKLYIFSELNECSLTLAEDIYDKRPDGKAPVIVFTDAYIDDENEKQSELLVRAGNIRAICLMDDIVHCRDIKKNTTCNIFLMDGADSGNDNESNLTTLCALLSENMSDFWKRKSNCMMFLFSNDEETVLTAHHVKNAFDKDENVSGKLVFRTVSSDTQLALRQMIQTPLYLPKSNSSADNSDSLHVVIFGDTLAAKEMFKTAFWCGQTLHKGSDCSYKNRKLKITVVYSRSKTEKTASAEAEYCAYLRREMPELIPSCTPGDECLRIYEDKSKSEFAPAYCELSFVETELGTVNAKELLEEVIIPKEGFGTARDEFSLKDADYFIVMTGSDKLNADIAGQLRKSLKQMSFISNDKSMLNKVIAFEISNNEVKTALNSRYSEGAPIMNAFGSLKDRYCWSNVVMDDIYIVASNQDILTEGHWYGSESKKTADDVSGELAYQRFSSISKEVHQAYKQFSAGCRAYSEYLRKCSYIRKIESDAQLRDALAWLEHRRWNAYTRASGYIYPGDENVRPDETAYKDIEKKLHPCLVETRMPCGDAMPDRLDMVSAKRGKNGKKVKAYDLPNGKYAPGFTKAELLCYFGIINTLTASEKELKACWEALIADHPELEVSVDSDKNGKKNKYGYYMANMIDISTVDVQKYRKLFESR